MTPSDWTSTKLAEVIDVIHGWPFRGDLMREQLSGGPIVVNIGNFDYEGGFRFDESRTREYVGDYPREYELKPGDLLTAMTCQTPGGEVLGVPGRIPADGRIYLHNQRLGKVVVTRADILDVGWLHCLFRSPDFHRYLVATASGTMILHTSPDRIKDYRVSLPPIASQRAIAVVLGALDNQIDANRRLSARLNELMMTVFKHVFHAPALATVPLTDLAAFINGKAFTKFADGAGRPILRIAELNAKVDANTLRSSVEAQADNLAFADDILFSWSGSLGVYRWHGQEALINQHIFKVIPKGVPAWLVYCNLIGALPFFRDTAADKATTMGHIQRRHLDEWRVPSPSPEALQTASPIITPAYTLVHVLARQSRCIAELRDILLPKLISGEIPAPVAERTIGSVA